MASRIDPSPHEERASWTSQGEFNRITDLQKELEYRGSFVASATRCQGLGWPLAAVDAKELADLGVNFSDAPEIWLQNLGLLGPLQGRVGLGVHTGATSRLLVLEVNSMMGKPALDQCGDWGSICRARVNGREQHYYTLPPGSPGVSTSFLANSQVMVYGEDGLAPVPPSVDIQTRETWRWLKPPWDFPPPEVPQPIWTFLGRHMPLPEERYPEPDVPSWEEVYHIISPHEQILKAVLAPTTSPEEYYRNLLQAALNTGLRDPAFLLGLLWHAPQGDAQQRPERWAQFEVMVNELKLDSQETNESLEVIGKVGPAMEAVILNEAPHCEAILDELKQLSHKAAELESMLSECEQDLTTDPDRAPLAQEASSQDFEGNSLNSLEELSKVENLLTIFEGRLHQGFKAKASAFERSLSGVIQDCKKVDASLAKLPQSTTKVQQPDIMKASVSACLEKNPDLADDPLKVQMIHYCFTNYVNIDPDLADLTLQERMDRASQMAREFLGIRGQA